PPAARLAHWSPYVSAHRPLDLVTSGGGTAVLEAGGRLYQLRASGRAVPIHPAYESPGGAEPYIAVPAAGHRGCSFDTGTIYAIRLANGRGVTRISASGRVRRFAVLSAPGLIDGIAFDETGAFGHRLLVTINHGSTTTVVAIDCRGAVTTIT